MLRVWRDNRGNAPPRAEEHRFALPEEDFRTLMESFDANTRGWHGERSGWTDGTGIAVERVRDGVVTSMDSNSQGWSQRNPAVRLLGDVQRLALAYGPSGTVPRSYSWHVQSRIEYPCADIGLNTPDPDGFGIGNDLCGQALAW